MDAINNVPDVTSNANYLLNLPRHIRDQHIPPIFV